MLLFRSGEAISNLLLMLRPLFYMTRFQVAPSIRRRMALLTSSCSYRWQDWQLPRQPVDGDHLTCRAVVILSGRRVFFFFFFLQPLSIFNLDACVNKSELYVSWWAVRKSSPSSASFFFSHLFSGIMRRDKWLPLAKGQTPACKTANN